MKTIISGIVAAALASASVAGATMSASAQPTAIPVRPAATAPIQDISFRGDWHGGGWGGGHSWHGGHRWGGYHDGWVPMGAFAAGALLGGAFAGAYPPYDDDYYYGPPVYREYAPPVYRVYGSAARHAQWCSARYRSYRAWDNTYQPNHGPRRQCIGP